MGNEIYPGVIDIPPALSGMNCCVPGSGLDSFIQVRAANDGTIANAETLNERGVAGKLTDGKIDISRATQINLNISIVFASLTSVDVIPVFSGAGVLQSYLGVGVLGVVANVGIITISPLRYRFLAALGLQSIMIPLQNPGAKYLQIYTASAGVVTSSAMTIDVGLGWANKEIAGV